MSLRTVIEGIVQSVTFADEESGFSIIRITQPSGGVITALGTLFSPHPGERVRLEGGWTEHPSYGRQFAVETAQVEIPTTMEGIESYLGSGLIKGVGKAMAARIVARFGEDTPGIIEHHPERLTEVPGIGAARLETIRRTWGEQREARAAILALQSMGVSAALAARLRNHYGEGAAGVIRSNPYRAAWEVPGVGFATADRIARQCGHAEDSPERARAGLLHVLQAATDEGHACLPGTDLAQRAQKLLQIPRDLLTGALDRLAAVGRVIKEDAGPDREMMVYLPQMLAAETGIAESLERLGNAPPGREERRVVEVLEGVEKRLGIDLAREQRKAVILALCAPVVVVTGGPGTGKTTILRAVLRVALAMGVRVELAAPTGRAAKRMSEASGHAARTIHRLLEYHPREGGFRRNRATPLECDLVIIDEASMVDIPLMYRLLEAVPPAASLVLVGDASQLPSVGPGAVLRDVIDSGRAEVVELTEVFRQARESLIIANAHRIRLGLLPQAQAAAPAAEPDYYFVSQEDPERASALVVRVVTERIPRRYGLDPLKDVQVLSPMHRGPGGVEYLNLALREVLNPQGEGRVSAGDKVMQVRNDYDREVYNGDVGRIVSTGSAGEEAVVDFDGRLVRYTVKELEQIVPAYAVSVHKAQGSEYPAVVMPLLMQHYLLLQRNLLYTAVTRARRLLVLVGSPRALAVAVKTASAQDRYTLLRQRLEAGRVVDSSEQA